MSSTRNAVLLVTHSKDSFTVDRVAEELESRRARVFRLNTDRFPSEVILSGRFDSGATSFEIEHAGESVRSEEVRAVWLRRLRPPNLSKELDARFRDVCVSESTGALLGFLDSLDGVRWIDRIWRIRESESKPHQLQLARRHGLQIPAALITNDPARAREFFETHRGAVITKLIQHPPESLVRSQQFLYTSEVKASDLEDTDGLRHSPALFQERIPKGRDLRAIFVDGHFFVGGIDPGPSGELLDWRRGDPAQCRWTKEELPDDVARKLNHLMRALELSYGAIDLIRTPDQRHVFLEVNSGGEWGMLERDLGHPISSAIADALLR